MKKLITILGLGVFSLGCSQSSYYNDYQRSISDYNWKTVAANLLLSDQQKADLFSLNNRYSDYNSWNSAYADNPDRWRTDRFSSMERIMGTEKYTKFKNQYYKGQNPVAVYNRNKNNHKKAQNSKYKTIQSEKGYDNTKSMKEYDKRKSSGDGSHVYIKGNHGNNGKGKGNK